MHSELFLYILVMGWKESQWIWWIKYSHKATMNYYFFNQVDAGFQIHPEIDELPLDAFLLVFFLLKDEHVIVEELLETFVGVVDAHLFERVELWTTNHATSWIFDRTCWTENNKSCNKLNFCKLCNKFHFSLLSRRSMVSRQNVHDKTFTDQTFIDKWFTTNGSRRMVRVRVRVRFRVRVQG